LNDQTTIVEADGKEWVSKVPAVSFFMPEQWFNVVALMEDKGIRYYCNLASPPYRYGNVLTYIDYDLDVVVLADGTVHELDRDDFKRHKEEYRYSEAVESHVETGLRTLRSTIANKDFPFGDSEVIEYYQTWKRHTNVKDEETDQ
jgi:protein associated with RNAse G/E